MRVAYGVVRASVRVESQRLWFASFGDSVQEHAERQPGVVELADLPADDLPGK